MKKLIIVFLAISMFSCKNKEDKNPKSELEKKITKRDLSITPQNSYSDLFLDSLAMEKFIVDNSLNDTIVRRMRSFYNARNFQYAWFTSNGLTEQARGFWNLHNYQTTYTKDTTLVDKDLQKIMDGLTAEDELSISSSDKKVLNTEFKMTEHFILYSLDDLLEKNIKRKEMERFIPRKKEDAMYLADSLITKKHSDDKYFGDINKAYGLLKEKLKTYYDINKAGGWPKVEGKAKDFAPGKSSPEIAIMKRYLLKTGDLKIADTSNNYNDTLVNGIKSFQARHGYEPTGNVSDLLLKDMNITAQFRLQQILINMGRMQWMVQQPKGKLITVNIPEYILHITDNGKKVFDMVVVVGKEGHNTTIFTGDLNQVVFSPYWNVPVSIVRKEILPGIEKDPNYLASHNMEIVNNDGSLPVVRQLPGPKNSLGKVKFLFPNSFDIYFH
ncbi:MAG: L,D-transpeptidase family protein, partial [Ferruginibacter sp.]